MAQPGQPAKGNKQEPQKFNWTRFIITFIVLGLLIVLLLWAFGVFKSHHEYQHWKDHMSLNADNVKSWSTDTIGHTLSVTYVDGTKHTYVASPYQIEQILDAMNSKPIHGLKPSLYTGDALPPKAPVNWLNIIIFLLPALILIGFITMMVRRGGGSGGIGEALGGGKNQARKMTSKKRFSDVAGQEEVKEEVVEVIDFLKAPNKYKAAGARIPKGILLGGPPGTGKTLIAKAVAGEAGVPFYFISASNFVEMFAGLGAKRVREMFKEARKAAPAILFIDELDAIGRKRGSSLSGNDEREQTLNQILVEMDGMDENSGMLIIAATNRTDVLDPALLRPGRFDRTITVGLPDIKEREAILRLHAKGKRVSSEVDFKNIAKRTPRYSGAQLENVVNEAALLSVRESSEVITLDHIDEAIDRVAAGPAKKHRVISPDENKMVAVHEAGHAVVGLKLEHADIVQKITIIPRGNAGGYTLMTPEKETYNYKKSQLLAMVAGLMGGRAAEQVIYGIGEVSTGASNDIERATGIARAMVTQYGMSHLGPIAYERDMGAQFLGGNEKAKEYSDALAERIDEAIREIVMEAEKNALETIKKNKKLLGLIVEELIDKETIVLEEIEYINKNLKRPPKNLVIKKDNNKKKSLKDIISAVESSETKIVAKKKSTKSTTAKKTNEK